MLGFPFSSYSDLLALKMGNVLLLKQNLFRIAIRQVIIRLLYGFNQPLFLAKKGPFIDHGPLNKTSISSFLPLYAS